MRESNLPIKLFKRGKVRDLYDLGDKLLIVATDRISVFDFVLPDIIPNKGKILTEISIFWFNFTSNIIKNHFITNAVPNELKEYSEIIKGRCMVVRKTNPIKVECIVRGWLYGSAWNEYKTSGKVCDVELPKGLLKADKLSEPIFTPTTKEEIGHDVSLTRMKLKNIVGNEIANFIENKSLEVYEFAKNYALKKGIIIADAKFEFGVVNDEIILIDEILTPDSSRFWLLEEYEPGKEQKSLDKQFVRDYVESIGWNKKTPPPRLPYEIIEKTEKIYLEIKNKLMQK